MILFLFLALQLIAAAAGGALLWRRIERQQQEIVSLRQALTKSAVQPARRAAEARARVVAIGNGAPMLTAVESVDAPPPPQSRFSLPEALAKAVPAISAETARGAALGLAAVLPALVFPFTTNHALIVACGICVAAGMMLLALNALWRAAAWGGVVSGGVWALIGFALHVAQAQPLVYCVALALAGATALTYAGKRDIRPGAALALIASGAALFLGAQIGMIGPAGAAFAIIVTIAAIIGALSLKLEGLHVAAFVATLAGLFVLSGQTPAAIWFTPVTAWAGALFLGIAGVYVPRLGARGMTLAATGALAPLLGIAALYDSHQGLADPRAAGAAFAGLAFLLGGVIALAAQRNQRGMAALKVTLWVLAIGAFLAAIVGSLLALPSPFAASALGAVTLGAAFLHARFKDSVWRIGACVTAALAAADASSSVALVLRETPVWNPALIVVGGLALPAALVGFAATLARRAGAEFTAGFCKLIAIALSVATADMVLRLVFSAGAPLLQPIGFVEAGCHIAAWLAIALVVAARGPVRNAHPARKAGVVLLGAGALAGSATTAALWLTSYWETLVPARTPWPPLHYDGLGFLAPAALYWAHWVFWRARGSNVRTRVSFAAAAAVTACFITLEAAHRGQSSESTSAIAGALSFAVAIVLNFAPGVVAGARRRRLHFQKYFHRDGRSEKRRQAR